ncbi:hypothetical protein [Actinoplanes sp. NPDC051494]|uniref:hypothetical protein n=1 Tax=Actinoplanes sp. NPDC051494 TaxID=3363907 RepID=UPI00379B7D94
MSPRVRVYVGAAVLTAMVVATIAGLIAALLHAEGIEILKTVGSAFAGVLVIAFAAYPVLRSP